MLVSLAVGLNPTRRGLTRARSLATHVLELDLVPINRTKLDRLSLCRHCRLRKKERKRVEKIK